MYLKIDPFGVQIYGKSLGDAWLSLVAAIVKHGDIWYDEKRKRIALQNVRIQINKHSVSDKLIEKLGDKKNLEEIIDLTFKDKKMRDCDVIPSFLIGAKSYYQRIKEGQMDEFVVKRLCLIPESKKAVMIFPTWQDYKAVLKNPWDDYLPCVVALQFRLIEANGYWKMNTVFFCRSIDSFQKFHGNLIAISMLSHKIMKSLHKKLKKKIIMNSMDGFITDAHIYGENIKAAKKLYKKANSIIW